MKKVNFVLGQEVVIEGKFVNEGISGYEIEESVSRITKTGEPEISHKYTVKKFNESKYGVVVGVRSIVASRIHYFDGEFVQTKTIRQPAVLVACDLRGTFLAPINMVRDYLDWVCEFGEDISAEVFGETI